MEKSNEMAKDTGLAVVLILLIVTWVTSNTNWVIPAIAVHILNMTVPVVFRPFSVVWLGLAQMMGNVVSKIILTILFIGVLMPIGLIRRLFGADSLNLKKWKKGYGTAFFVRDHCFGPGDVEKPY